jgi:hypothetical protein
MKPQLANVILYIVALIALLYLASPHIVELYVSYSRPWDTQEDQITEKTVEDELEHMTNEKIQEKQDFHDGEPTAWDKDAPMAEVPLPGKEPQIEVPKEEKVNQRTLDTKVQKTSLVLSKGPAVKPVPVAPKISSKKITQVGEQIRGPRAPEIDPNEPKETETGKGKFASGVYPYIYGPDVLDAPGSKDNLGGDSSNPPAVDYVPAAEFPAGPLYPSPYLNDFSKILKT